LHTPTQMSFKEFWTELNRAKKSITKPKTQQCNFLNHAN